MTPRMDASLRGLLTFQKGANVQIGASRIRLLKIISAEGSIAAAAKIVGLSYKGAWDAVQALNNLSRHPLITTQAGGARGGVAVVTPKGMALIQAYERLETLMDSYVEQVSQSLDMKDADMSDLMAQLSIKTSARNAYQGVISEIRDGAVNAEVVLKVSDKVQIVATVTRDSVTALGLTVGRRATALIKASFVVLATGHGALPVSAGNRLFGVISSIIEGAVNDEVTLDLDEGKTLTATITQASRKHLNMQVGQPAQALINASHVILAVD